MRHVPNDYFVWLQLASSNGVSKLPSDQGLAPLFLSAETFGQLVHKLRNFALAHPTARESLMQLAQTVPLRPQDDLELLHVFQMGLRLMSLHHNASQLSALEHSLVTFIFADASSYVVIEPRAPIYS